MIRALVRVAVCILWLTLAHTEAFAQNHSSRLVEYLAHEKTALAVELNEMSAKPSVDNKQQLLQKIKQNTLQTSLNDARLDSLNTYLSNQNKLLTLYNQQIKNLQQSALSQQNINTQSTIDRLSNEVIVIQKTISLIEENLNLATRYQNALSDEKQRLDIQQARLLLLEQLKQYRQAEQQTSQELEQFYQSNTKLQSVNKTNLTDQEQLIHETRLFLNHQYISLAQYRLSELDLQKRLLHADIEQLDVEDIKSTQQLIDLYRVSMEQFHSIDSSLKNMQKLVEQQESHDVSKALKEQFDALKNAITQRQNDIELAKQTLQEDLDRYTQLLKKKLSVRQSLSEYSPDSWPSIAGQLLKIPTQFYDYAKSLLLKAKNNYLWTDPLYKVLLWLGLVVLFGVVYVLNHYIKKIILTKERQRLSGHLYEAILSLIQRNLVPLTLIAISLWILFMVSMPLVQQQLLLNLLAVWVVFKTVIQALRLFLLERVTDESGRDVALYHKLKWLCIGGGWITALMVFSHLLPLSGLVQDLFNRLFMIFILAVSFVLWRSREMIPYLFKPLLRSRKKYVRHVLYLLAWLIPLTLFTTALIGIYGFVNLAWTLSRYQLYILLVLVLYVILRGIFLDLLEMLSEWMIRNLQSGWLWNEVFLKPIDVIVRISIIIISVILLFYLFDLLKDERLHSLMIAMAYHPIVNISGIHITIASTLEFIVLVALFLWVAKWTREFAYRWLYRNARDPGIRHSLSVFTQYAVVLVGSFITLRVLGLDFSGMSMVLGGLAVGMGFGLRDFASNIIGGIMLLIERPVREGDLITLGGYEGRVAHIGIRSMRVSSWDNMEVLIPNAETFNKPFTNWTHQDSIVRTVIPIKVSREDDPVIVQKLIFDVLAIIPEILEEPPSQVYLKQIDDALIEFEVRYFINVEIHTRFEVKSKVLFAIFAQFKAAGIKPPIPPMRVEMSDHPGEYFIGKSDSKE